MTTQEREQKYLVHVYQRYPAVLTSGSGCYTFDEEGRKYLDAITGVGVNALGYGHPRIVRAMEDQMRRAVHLSNLFYHPYQAQLAERLCGLAALDRAFFCSTGTEAVEAALKASLARGKPLGKTAFVALERSFHGRTLGSLSVTGQPKYREPFETHHAHVTFVAPNDAEALRAAVGKNTAALILEPVLGEGGIVPLNDAFLQQARELATLHGALLIADEIQCGLGRTGRVFAFEWAGIQPDIVTVAKPLAAGLPLGAAIFSEEAAAGLTPGSHGTTFGGGPLACRVALEFLDVMESLLTCVTRTGQLLAGELNGLSRKHASIRQVRSKGLMLGLELNTPARPVVERLLEFGVLANATQGTVLRLLPAYVWGPEQVGELIQALDRSL